MCEDVDQEVFFCEFFGQWNLFSCFFFCCWI